MNLPLRRSVAALVSASILVACPGLAPYAAAQTMTRATGSGAGVMTVVPVMGAGASFNSAPSLAPSALSLAPSLGAASVPTLNAVTPAAAALTVLPAAVVATPVAMTAPAALKPALSAASVVPAVKPAALAKTVSAAAKDTAAALEKLGPVSESTPSNASGLGRKLEDLLTGAPALSDEAAALPAASHPMGDLGGGFQLARPAGESISQSAASQNSELPPTPPTPPSAQAPAPRGPQGPFWPRLLSAGLALLPAVFLGLPLLGASAYLVGGLVIAASASLAVMPFLSETSPKSLRAAPGFLIGALGLAALGVSLSLSLGLGVAVAPALAWTGLLALVGGWGLARYGLGKTEGRYGSYASMETLSAFFGGLAALTGVALAASTPLGWAASAVLWLSYPLSALLWFHLPGWIGKGVGAAFEGLWLGVYGLSRVLTSIHRDTVLLDRLQNFSRRHWTASKWNGVWLAVMWTPIMLAEALMYVLSAAGGLFVGAVSAPVNFLWAATQKLWPKSVLNVYFAEAARVVFDNVQNGKVSRYNPIEAKLIPVANSRRFLVSAAGSLGLRVLQVGWLAYSLVAAPLLTVAGLVLAFGRVKAYDEKRHDSGYLRVTRNDSPSEKPTEPNEPEPGTPAKAPIAPKLIATALALVPAYFFGLPILAGHSIIQIGLYFPLVLALAAMPFLSKAPMWAKSLAGKAMIYNGLVFLLNGNAPLLGILVALGGWGFERWVKKTAESEGSFDEASLGAFFGALGAAAAVGAVWAGFFGGLIGWGTLALAAVTSPFLLMHLPRWVGEGVGGFFSAFPDSMRAWHKVLGFWSEDTKFYSNLRSHADYWLKKTFWNGVWLSAIWVPTALVSAVEYVLSFALGLVTGLFRAPFQFAASAFAKAKPNSKPALFTAGLVEGWKESSEGSKGFFDAMIAKLKPAIDEAAPETGRPTAKAVGALLLARVAQLLWLTVAVVMNVLGFAFIWGLIKGTKAAFAPAK